MKFSTTSIKFSYWVFPIIQISLQPVFRIALIKLDDTNAWNINILQEFANHVRIENLNNYFKNTGQNNI